MKLLLSAQAVAKLIEIDPDGSVDLAKSAAKQVAQEVARRVTKATVQSHIENFLNAEMMEGTEWYRKHISSKYEKALLETMNSAASGFIKALVDGEINKELKKRVEETIVAMMPRIDAAITLRAEEMFRLQLARIMRLIEPPTETKAPKTPPKKKSRK